MRQDDSPTEFDRLRDAAPIDDAWHQSERGRLHIGWQALRQACRATHKPGPGGAAICICGAACGGSTACGMLGTLRDLIRYVPAEKLPEEWQKQIAELRRIV